MSEKHLLTKPFASYAHWRRCGDLVYIAGQGCRDPETNLYAGVTYGPNGKTIVSYDITAQTKGVFKNIERALADCKLSKKNLVDITVFLTTMDDFDKMNKIWNEFFGSTDQAVPTRTTIAVKQLPGDNFVEMKAIAYDS